VKYLAKVGDQLISSLDIVLATILRQGGESSSQILVKVGLFDAYVEHDIPPRQCLQRLPHVVEPFSSLLYAGHCVFRGKPGPEEVLPDEGAGAPVLGQGLLGAAMRCYHGC